MNTKFYTSANCNRKQLIEAKSVKRKITNLLSYLTIVVILSACAAFSGRETAGEYMDDASITAAVKNEFIKDPKLSAFQIHVETFKNQVQLSGFVDSQTESLRAGQIARDVQGVKDVRNNIVVRKKTPKMGRSR